MQQIYNCTSIQFQKFYYPFTVRKNCSSDREKKIKFEAEVREFAKKISQQVRTILKNIITFLLGIPIARVAGGMNAPKGSNPWAASIRLHGFESGNTYHHCGGVLLSEFHILTAAHCMETHPLNTYRIRVGDWDAEVKMFQI